MWKMATKIVDREEWVSVIKDVKDHSGLQRQ